MLYAGTDRNGVFKSSDGAANWGALNNGLTNLMVRALAVSAANPAIVHAGTAGGGVFTIEQGEAPETPTPTGGPQPTATPSVTGTPGGGTPTATPIVDCVGDCDEGGVVTVDELVTGVNIALGTTALEQCVPFDSNGDQLVTVDELVRGVGNALDGCPA